MIEKLLAGPDEPFDDPRAKQPKLSASSIASKHGLLPTSEYTIADLAEVFTVSRATVYRILQRYPAAGAG